MNIVHQESVVIKLHGGFFFCGEDGKKTQYGFIYPLIVKVTQ
jgi:hypothetical protein